MRAWRSDETGFPADRVFSVGAHRRFPWYAELKAGQPTALPDDRSLGAVMNYTSGTTGRPKGVRRPLPDTPHRGDGPGRGAAAATT